MRSPLIEPNRTPQLRKLAFKIINSTTILLPAWYDVLASLKLPQRNMPRDVPTRWNSTYDMLRFALKYEKAKEYDPGTGARPAHIRAESRRVDPGTAIGGRP